MSVYPVGFCSHSFRILDKRLCTDSRGFRPQCLQFKVTVRRKKQQIFSSILWHTAKWNGLWKDISYHKRLYWFLVVMEADLNESGGFKCLFGEL